MLKATRSQLAELREKRFCINAICYDVDRVQTSPNRENFNALSDMYIDLEQKYLEDEIRLTALKMEIKGYIDMLDNPVHRLIMTERYINIKTFEQIAVDNYYSWKWVHRLHGEALGKLKQYIEVHNANMIL